MRVQAQASLGSQSRVARWQAATASCRGQWKAETHAPFNLMRHCRQKTSRSRRGAEHRQISWPARGNLCCVTVTTWQCHSRQRRRRLQSRQPLRGGNFVCGIFNLQFLSFRQLFGSQSFWATPPPPHLDFLTDRCFFLAGFTYSAHGQTDTDDGTQHVLHLGLHLVEAPLAGYHTGRVSRLSHYISTTRSQSKRYQGNLYTWQHCRGELPSFWLLQ